MSRRQYRAAALAKRQDFDLYDLSDEQRDQIDAAYERTKYDPAAQQQRLHDRIQHQQRMLRTLGENV